MTIAFLKLFIIEFKRIWTLPKLIIIGILFLLVTTIGLLISNSEFLTTAPDAFFPSISYTMVLSTIFGMIVPMSALFFSAGIIAYDIKSHWLRSILSRPLTRTDFLMSKIASAAISLLIVMLIVATIPLLIFGAISSTKLQFDFGNFIYLHLAYWLEGILFIVISSFFSTFLTTFKNVFLLGVWMFIDNIQLQVVPGLFWDNQTLLLLSDFFFPNSWSDSAKALLSTGNFNYEHLLWGIAELTGFTAITIYVFTKIGIDKSGE